MPQPRKRLPRSFKFLAYAVVSFFALIPLAFIGFFQQTHLAQETVAELALNIASLAHEAQDGEISPNLAVAWMGGHKLVLWASYYKNDTEVAHSGLSPRTKEVSLIRDIVLKTDQSIPKQFPEPQFLMPQGSEYRFILPIHGQSERMEVGVSYETLFSAAHDTLVLSGTLFFLAFVFLLGAVLFVDAYVSSFTMNVIRAIRSRSTAEGDLPAGLSQKFAPTYSALMDALDYREDQVIGTRETLETVFNGLKSGVAMISTEMQIVLVNQYFHSLLPADPGEDALVGKPCLQLNLNGQSPTVEELCANTLRTLEMQEQEVKIGDRYFAQEAYPLLDAEKQPIAIIVQCRDITDEKNANEKIQNFNNELRQKLDDQKIQIENAQQKVFQAARMASVGELAGGVAHEINNPNGVILAGARYVMNRLQSEANVPEYVPKYLERISKNAERVAQIVNSLLTFSRRRPLNKEPMIVTTAIDEAIELAEARVGQGKITFHKDLPKDVPPINGNRGQLAQVFLNLFNNAVDAMPNGGEIHITSEVVAGGPKGQLKIRVRDTGHGINPELLDKISEPFFTTKPLGKGTGLGLSVSYGIVEEHGGKTKASNHPSGGAEFELTFPVAN